MTVGVYEVPEVGFIAIHYNYEVPPVPAHWGEAKVTATASTRKAVDKASEEAGKMKYPEAKIHNLLV
jgi:hypothetical protein